MQQHPFCLLLCVNYRLPELTARFVGQVISTSTDIEVAIADNDGSLDASTFDEPRVLVSRQLDNPGYLGGCALALEDWRRARGRLPEWVGIVNTDIEFSSDFFPALRQLSLPGEVGAIAPAIHLPDGTPQNPFMVSRPHHTRMARNIRIFSSGLLFALWDTGYYVKRRLKHLWAHAGRADDVAATPSYEIYAPYGAAMFLRPSFFAGGGTLHFRAFMYQEELFIAEQLRQMGLSCRYVPQLHITHRESRIMRLVGFHQRRQWKLESARAIVEDYFTTT